MGIMKEEYIPFVDELIELAIREDIGDGDHSSLACIPHDQRGRMKPAGVKQDGIFWPALKPPGGCCGAWILR